MFCPNCGKETPADRSICIHCGAELKHKTSAAPGPADRTQVTPSAGIGKTTAAPFSTPIQPDPEKPAPESSASEETLLREALKKRYEIIRKLGSGGMASVYLAREIALNREVAIKVLPQALLRDGDFVERFKNEAQIAANLEHPNIVRIYQIGEEKNLCYFVMSYIPGGSISDQIKKNKTIEIEDIIQWGAEVCSALSYAHQQGVIHRDLKPDNIMLDKSRRAVVMDFGIARAAVGARLTQTGAVIGTPQYMSPEQARGKGLDGRSDIYSMGMVLYQMAAGSLPFQGPDAASLMYMHVHENPEPPDVRNAKVPVWLRDIILKCLSKNPDDRFATADELGKALSVRMRPKLTRTLMADRPGVGKNRKALYIGLTIIAVAAIGFFAWQKLSQSPSVPKATVTPAPAGEEKTAPDAQTREDDSAFRQAEMVNTEQSYTIYFKSFPQGRHASESQTRITAFQANKPLPKPEIKSEQPQTSLKPTAPVQQAAPEASKQADINREDNLAFQQAEIAGTKQAYSNYLKIYPSGVHVADAKAKITVLDEQDTQKTKAQAEEENRREDQAFHLAENTRTVQAYKTYLITYPNGRHSSDAKARISAFEEAAAANDRIRVALNTLSMKLVNIPGGTFMMGSDKGGGDEKPAHAVTVSVFQMSETEITQTQYQELMKSNPAFFKVSGSNPVERVSWFDAIAFCNRLSEKAKLDPCYDLKTGTCDFFKNGFRLPTEAEWEYACRAETGTDYSTGEGPNALNRAGWYVDNSGEKSHPVGQKTANAWGLLDMHGNVWEWCQDWYAKDYYGGSTKQNVTGPASGSERVLRGGSWIDNTGACKASKRRSYNPNKNYSDIGFRVARR
jgi:serine/threonine-protein kinase PpkA